MNNTIYSKLKYSPFNPANLLPSAQCELNNYLFPLSYVRKQITTKFKPTDTFTKYALKEYFLLHYTGVQFTAANNKGIITKNDKQHIIVFDKCFPEQCKRADKLLLSFRTALPIYNLPSYVIIQCAK